MPNPPRYQLDSDKVLETVRTLRDRIGDRFPDSGLFEQAGELVQIGERARGRIHWISRPNWLLRIFIVLLIAMLIAAVAVVFMKYKPQVDRWDFQTVVGLMESGINDIFFIGVGIFFLITLETRFKRRRALNALHELRSMAHVIDMHQLTRDPDRLVENRSNTSHSPKTNLNAFELRRYLDYCSEMLSLTSKIASTYIQKFDDSATAATVNEIESLTTGLARKIWQKIMILQEMSDAPPAPSAPPSTPETDPSVETG